MPYLQAPQLDLVVIAGPTAVGKTAVSIELAQRLSTEIISADSMQVYKLLSIGTAKPTRNELKGIVYHLIDFVDPDYQYNLGDFVSDADRIITKLQSQQKLPIVCGGTGLYIKGLLQGIFNIPSRDPDVRRSLEERCAREGLFVLHEELKRIDPDAAHIMPNDKQRILRALEVYLVTGQPISRLQQQFCSTPRYRAAVFVLSMSRPSLYRRICERVDKMLQYGWLDEAQRYLAAGYSENNPAVKALGYRELFAFLRGKVSFEEAVALIKRRTCQFAKRQLTWFRAMTDAKWINVENRTPQEVAEKIAHNIEFESNHG